MSSSLYLLFFVLPVILSILIILFIINKKNSHTELYSEGVRNENEGRYNQALRNYEGALAEIRKLRMNRKFGKKIAERIKILQTTINYEKNFQDGVGS
jgi:outer membrane protein assembly factor BamD (BamD/ComL family)